MEKNNFKFKKFKLASIGITLATMGIASLVSGVPNKVNTTNETSIEQPVVNPIPTPTTENITSFDDSNIDITQSNNVDALIDSLLENYNSLGNNLNKDDLGCVVQTNEGVSYLFKDENGKYIFDITQNAENLNRVTDDYTLLTFVDKTNECKPIAGTVEIKSGDSVVYSNVDVRSVDVANVGRTVKDANKYVSSFGLMPEDFQVAKSYYEIRKEKMSKGM